MSEAKSTRGRKFSDDEIKKMYPDFDGKRKSLKEKWKQEAESFERESKK